MAKSNFARALDATLRFEGGYAHHPRDPGGPTNMGVTRRTLAEWRGQAVSDDDVRDLARAEAAAIYRRLYWELAGCDHLPGGVDLVVFDYAVNSGVDRASRALQSALGVTVDGIVGRATIEAARDADSAAVVVALSAARRGFLRRLPIFAIFGRGWLRRVAAIEALAHALAPPRPPTGPAKETIMPNSKSIVESRTVWANVVGLAALAATLFGFDVSGVDQGAVVDAALKAVAGFGFVASTIFRIRATKKLG